MSDLRDPLAGLKPMRPPLALRALVLAAAREAAAQRAPSLLDALYGDRLLRLCAAGLAALVIANVLVAGGGGTRTHIAMPAVFAIDDAAIPGDTGLTAAEQLDGLEPVLREACAGSRG